MANRTKTRPEPELLGYRVVKRPRVEPEPMPTLRKEYWDDAIRRARGLRDDQALELSFEDFDYTSAMESGARRAAARAGIRLCVAIRGTAVYLWEKRQGSDGKKKA